MTDLPAALGSLSERLERAGFRRADGPRSESFGDMCVVFERSPIEVRLVADRGLWFVEVRRSGWDDWFDPDTWRACLHDRPLEREPRPLAQQAEFVAAEMEPLAAAVDRRLAARSVRSCLERKRAARSRLRLGLDG